MSLCWSAVGHEISRTWTALNLQPQLTKRGLAHRKEPQVLPQRAGQILLCLHHPLLEQDER